MRHFLVFRFPDGFHSHYTGLSSEWEFLFLFLPLRPARAFFHCHPATKTL
jgi:hypothetical protein